MSSQSAFCFFKEGGFGEYGEPGFWQFITDGINGVHIYVQLACSLIWGLLFLAKYMNCGSLKHTVCFMLLLLFNTDGFPPRKSVIHPWIYFHSSAFKCSSID